LIGARSALLLGRFFDIIVLRLLLLSSFLARDELAAGQPSDGLFLWRCGGAGAQIAFQAVRAVYE